jgi:hypothetical protein
VVCLILAGISTLLLIVLMAVQTDKAEQGGGGVMGWAPPAVALRATSICRLVPSAS